METFSALLALCAGNSPVPVNSPHKRQWRGALMFSLICAWINDWVNNREAGDLRRHHYDVIVMCRYNTIDYNMILHTAPTVIEAGQCHPQKEQWKTRAVMMPTLSSSVAPGCHYDYLLKKDFTYTCDGKYVTYSDTLSSFPVVKLPSPKCHV